MKKGIVLFFFILFVNSLFAQTNFDNLLGEYNVKRYERDKGSNDWRFIDDRIFKVISIDTSNCQTVIYQRLKNNTVWGTLGDITINQKDGLYVCNKTEKSYAYVVFYEDSIYYNNDFNFTPYPNFREYDVRYYGKKIVTGIEDKQEKIENKLYPNPAQDYIMLPEVATNEQLDLYNSQGVKQETPNAISEDGELQIDTSTLENGLYLLEVNDRVYRFVKE